MLIFISWSGERSRLLAQILRDWLQNVIQNLEPWMSSEDIEKGARWSPEIANRLEECRIGIICLSPENQDRAWLNFEAGAISKTVKEGRVCGYLLGMTPADVTGPLTQFQLTTTDRDDTQKLMLTINKALGDQGLRQDKLDAAFDRWWPDLEKALKDIPPPPTAVPPRRSPDDMIAEILETVRGLAREGRARAVRQDVPRFEDILDHLEAVPLPPSAVIWKDAAEGWNVAVRSTAGLHEYTFRSPRAVMELLAAHNLYTRGGLTERNLLSQIGLLPPGSTVTIEYGKPVVMGETPGFSTS